MNTFIGKNTNNINQEENISMDLSIITNIISHKINNIKIIDDTLIEELCNDLKLYCIKHNKKINIWFDENYTIDLETFKNNNKKYL